MSSPPSTTHLALFAAYDKVENAKAQKKAVQAVPRNALQSFMHKTTEEKTGNGFQRMQKCRDALDGLDRHGWQRSFHQRLFHDNFIRACSRIFWKTEPAGAFARDHQKILEMNGWDHLSQEILVSTPRRSAWPYPISILVDCVASCRRDKDNLPSVIRKPQSEPSIFDVIGIWIVISIFFRARSG
jgi:hypothetical protein